VETGIPGASCSYVHTSWYVARCRVPLRPPGSRASGQPRSVFARVRHPGSSDQPCAIPTGLFSVGSPRGVTLPARKGPTIVPETNTDWFVFGVWAAEAATLSTRGRPPITPQPTDTPEKGSAKLVARSSSKKQRSVTPRASSATTRRRRSVDGEESSSRVRDGERTRAALVVAAFEEMHRQGYQGSSIDRILERVGVTRGALFHHFPSKLALGLAVVDEHIREGIAQSWLVPLERGEDALTAIADLIDEKARSVTAAEIQLGCPLNNLAQEMSPLDEQFRELTRDVFAGWRGGITARIAGELLAGRLVAGVDPEQAALAVLALYEGGVSLAKNEQSRAPLLAAAAGARRYLESLRAGRRRSARPLSPKALVRRSPPRRRS
jgi:TetR/AcrR family transcriptional regulator, transcriptional repressor for nem operon